MNIALKRSAVVVSGVLVFALVYWFSVLTERGQSIENNALEAAVHARTLPVLLTFVTIPGLAIATLVIVGVALLQHRLDAALQAAIILVVCNVATQLLKYHLLDRPFFEGALRHNTFPSGHTTAYLTVTLALVLVVPTRWRALASAVGAVFTTIVVIELLGYGWHRLSDIVGAATLVLAVMTLALMFVRAPGWLRHNQALSTGFQGFWALRGVASALRGVASALRGVASALRGPRRRALPGAVLARQLTSPRFERAIMRAFFITTAALLSCAVVTSALSLVIHSRHDNLLLISSLLLATATVTGVFFAINRVLDPRAQPTASTVSGVSGT